MADNKIELRSEKVRHIIGEIPSRIVRYGITIITFVIWIADWCILYTLSRNHQCKYTDDKCQSRHNIHSL